MSRGTGWSHACEPNAAAFSAPTHQPPSPRLPAGIGIQFLDMDEENRGAILAFVKSRLPSPRP